MRPEVPKSSKDPEVMKRFVGAHEGRGNDQVLIGDGRAVKSDYSSFDRVAVLAVEVFRDDKKGYKVGENGGDEGVDGVNALLHCHRGKRFTKVRDALERLVQGRGEDFTQNVLIGDMIVRENDSEIFVLVEEPNGGPLRGLQKVAEGNGTRGRGVNRRRYEVAADVGGLMVVNVAMRGASIGGASGEDASFQAVHLKPRCIGERINNRQESKKVLKKGGSNGEVVCGTGYPGVGGSSSVEISEKDVID